MSDKQTPGQPVTTRVATHESATPNDAWGQPISEERQTELQGYLDRWQAETDHGGRQGPFDNGPANAGVFLTGADVFWLATVARRSETGNVSNLHLEGAHLVGAHLEGAFLGQAHLQSADLRYAHLEGASLGQAHLEGTYLHGSRLHGALLRESHLEGTDLREAHLEGKMVPSEDLARIRQWSKDFPERLPAADLRLAFLNVATMLNGACLGTPQHGCVRIADVRWGGVNLAVVDLPSAHLLGDESETRQAILLDTLDGRSISKSRAIRLEDFRAAVRANRQLAVALLNIGLNEEAARFVYRAQFLQQKVLLRQRKFGAYIFSRFLDGIAGYGYKPMRGLIAYVLVIAAFAISYGLATHGVLTFGLSASQVPPLQWYEALVLSISAFHGRGFFQPVQSLGDPVAILAAAEAIIGLLIEISFIATFTQRFFGTK